MSNDEFDSELKCVKECSLVSDDKWEIALSYPVYQKIWSLYNEYKSLEWLGYLVGTKIGTVYTVTALLIPEQEVTSTSVEVDPDDPVSKNPSIVGTVHSHVNMGVFFSGTDEDYIGLNHDVMVVVSKGEMKAQVRVAAPCGALKKNDAEVTVDYPPIPNMDRFITLAKSKITEHRYHVTYYNGYVPGRPTAYVAMNDIDDDLQGAHKPILTAAQRRSFIMEHPWGTPLTQDDINKLRAEVGLTLKTPAYLGNSQLAFGDDDTDKWLERYGQLCEQDEGFCAA